MLAETCQYRAFLLDMSGVLQHFGKAVRGASDFVRQLLSQGIPFIIITNECRYTNESLRARLEEILGLSIPSNQIYTSANAVGAYLRRAVADGYHGNVFVVGEAGLRTAVEEALAAAPGARVLTSASPEEDSSGLRCDFVVVGSVFTGGPNDNMIGAERASSFLRRGAKLIYSCPDWFEVSEQGSYKFGCPMPVIDLLMQCTGCSAYNLGKPNPFMLRQASKQLNDALLNPLSEGEILFVGDSLNTDMLTAVEHDIDAALVLSGTTDRGKLASSAIQPNYVFEDIEELHIAFQQGRLRSCGLVRAPGA